jgi:hypothetical protein
MGASYFNVVLPVRASKVIRQAFSDRMESFDRERSIDATERHPEPIVGATKAAAP